MAKVDQLPLYRTIWRWHFYAGLFVIPFILLLSVTGALYLFKPQTDRWEERAWRDLPAARTVDADAQVAAALAAFPGARYQHYRIPGARSEEHTPELQSLMRISHAVFHLKKQTK